MVVRIGSALLLIFAGGQAALAVFVLATKGADIGVLVLGGVALVAASAALGIERLAGWYSASVAARAPRRACPSQRERPLGP